MVCNRLKKVGKKSPWKAYSPNIMIIHHVNTSSRLNDMRVVNVYIVVINSNGENGLGNFDGNFS